MMQRRLLLRLVAGLAVAAPIAAFAQQGKIARIGYLGTSSPKLESHYVNAFVQTLRELGRVEGENIVVDYRWAEGHDDRLPGLAQELIALVPDVIVTTGTPGTLAVERATKTIPIVFASSADPVHTGIVGSLARPGGNATGFTILGPELEAKRLEILKETVTGMSKVAVLRNPDNPATVPFYDQIKAAAPALGIALTVVAEVKRPEDLERGLAAIAAARPDAMVVIADRLLMANRSRIVEFAAAGRLPAIYPYREYVDDGGLMSYATSNVDLFRGAAAYVDKILNGAKPADLPVQEPKKFEFVLNLKTAKALDMRIPQSILLRADEVIE
jgi:putative ABC transport system substrate-binding protein